jgi:hypothetical protein
LHFVMIGYRASEFLFLTQNIKCSNWMSYAYLQSKHVLASSHKGKCQTNALKR